MKQLKKLTAVLCTILTAFISIDVKAEQHDNITDLGLQAKSAILMEVSTGDVLYEQNSDEKLPPASITKIMTLLLIYEAEAEGKIKWDDKVTVSEHAASMGGSQVFLEAGETQTVADMTKCIAIASANDAAVAMAEYIGGSEEGFAELMNKRAKELGMENTEFKNACGLDADGHLTTARDIAVMSRQLMGKFPDIIKYTTTWQDKIMHVTGKGSSEFGLTNTNKLIRWYDGATGLKTGSTGNEKYCLSATAEKNGMSLIAVIMAAPDNKSRFSEAIKLLDYGYANYAVATGAKKGDKAGEISVSKGETETVAVEVADDISALILKGGAEPELIYELTDSLCAPLEKGTKAGEAVYKLDGNVVARADVVTSEGVERAAFPTVSGRLLRAWCK